MPKKNYMSVKEMGDLLGIKKTDRYWLIKKNLFNVVTVAGKMWVEIGSFEEWYSGQDHYHKVWEVSPEIVAKKYYSIKDIMELLKIGESTAYAIIVKEKLPAVRLYGAKRILKKDFWRWYDRQSKYKVAEEELPGRARISGYLSLREAARLIDASILKIYELAENPEYLQCLKISRFDNRDYISESGFGEFLKKQKKYTYDPKREEDSFVADNNYLTIQQAQWYAGVSKATVMSWCREAYFPVKRSGKCVRIPYKEFRDWLQYRERRFSKHGIHT